MPSYAVLVVSRGARLARGAMQAICDNIHGRPTCPDVELQIMPPKSQIIDLGYSHCRAPASNRLRRVLPFSPPALCLDATVITSQNGYNWRARERAGDLSTRPCVGYVGEPRSKHNSTPGRVRATGSHDAIITGCFAALAVCSKKELDWFKTCHEPIGRRQEWMRSFSMEPQLLCAHCGPPSSPPHTLAGAVDLRRRAIRGAGWTCWNQASQRKPLR